MPKTLSLAGTLSFPPTDPARPAPIPVAFSGIQYSQVSQQDLVFTGAQSNVPLNEGTITAPKFIYLEVLSGSIDVSKSNSNANPFTLTANPTPVAAEQAAFLMLYTYGSNGTLYITSAGPAQVRAWFFQ